MINNLLLKNFRSYSSGSFEFVPGVNIIVGPNASGKTNLLEAILVLCRGSSYRAKDLDLIKLNKPWARLDGFFDKQNRSLKLEKMADSLDKTYLLDDKPYKRLSLEKTVPVVYFEPNHLQLINRGPDQRRDYVDELLERTAGGFKTTLAAYKRTLAQRNALLKQGPRNGPQQLFAWDVRLSQLGEKIAQSRQELADQVNKNITGDYNRISQQKTKVLFRYDAQFQVDRYASSLLNKLQKTHELDFQRGFTGHGPHREDFSIILGKQNAGNSASRGESRSLILALKIFELSLIEKNRSQPPLFLLDDVFSELDGARRHALVDHLKNYQTIITTTDADAVIEYFATGAQQLITLNKA